MSLRPGDDDWLDLPYYESDLQIPGFDPFEAHKAWALRRLAATPQQEALARQAVLARIDEEMRNWKPPKYKKRKKVDESKASIKLWKAALKALKRKS